MRTGIIVARFQTSYLHEGHHKLIQYVLERNDRVIIFLGTTVTRLTINNPLDYKSRAKMIASEYNNPCITIAPLPNMDSDEEWSKHLDSKIFQRCNKEEEVTLYASRGGFIETYCGEHKTEFINDIIIEGLSATEIRTAIHSTPIYTKDWREGVIWASANSLPEIKNKQFENNIITDTDFYKLARHLTTKRGTTNLYSYGEPRIGAEHDHTMYFGGQIIIQDHLVGKVVTQEKIDYARMKTKAWGGYSEYFNEEMWNTILNKFDGKLPIRIKAVKEGALVPISNPLFTIEALDPIAVPLVSHVETLFSHIWLTSTICTNSFYIKKTILKYLQETGTPDNIERMLIFFGYRSATCQEHAKRGDMANMVHFVGSDTTVADRGIDFHYGYSKPARLQSVFATEHSDAQLFGRGEGEYTYVKDMLTIAPDDAIVSLVTDTYDGINFIDNVINRPDVKEMILKRKGKTIFRMDSGNMIEVMNRSINSLANNFGYALNDKNYKVLNGKVGTLCSNDVHRKSIPLLYESLKSNGYSADNMLVGSGNGTMQDFSRDDQRFAIKSSWAIVDGEEVNLIKDPKTESFKKSKAGRLKLHQSDGVFSTISSANGTPKMFESYADSLETVFEMGELKRHQSFDDVIKIANSYL